MSTPSNTRVFYPTQAVGIAPFISSTAYSCVRGVQNVGLSGRLGIEYLHEVGNLPTYDTYEEVPEVEVNIERLLTGDAPAYLLATAGASAASLIGRSNQRCHVALSIHRDNLSEASGNQIRQATCSGMFATSVGYDFSASAPARETLGLVGNNSRWSTGSFTFTGHTAAMGVTSLEPAAPEGVNRRQHFNMADCLLPTDIPGIENDNTNPEVVVNNIVQYAASLESVRVAANLNRTSKMELGRKAIYSKNVNWPVEVTCSIEFVAKDGDNVDFLEDGAEMDGDNTTEQPILITLEEGLVLDLGTRNRLVSKSHSGGQAGGQGQDVMISFSYTNHNELSVKHPLDPTVALRP